MFFEVSLTKIFPALLEAWKTWAQFGNYDFPEKYCHKTGKESYGKTSMAKPILGEGVINYERGRYWD
ncbi:hypothetical protein [Pontibacter sp. G13]|uniref:hypothetical protein n=1 Tax=Pontibacter sp. G13 TaxID=3074898 RepID=UPI0028890EA3|nr:hypothetical protein [Pontibacter sp. G13]WNJ17160.1 hypothetical protein RJD25_20075 [Pontibacter sp. G13]